ncbi:bifunctional diaminohydroxyphosphoribosylaminopyrimidine deaminase/5-amino-6-(5-phosphoribosylamino)uracil reductase RibD [Bacillus altitudinis]|uniref:bifunctional diaminohydroxyphosphoribosylaminopyrimidine deaminase/5-amino-6-(5-phosphoribosylamino)uracil reductase RibD n=1 Tax=Bacillus altitudinis TaxID=293387 RepID=UPI00061A3132|nr:bifunctional diaminohydroxyphosphoribosylaminopyrimidine deaminase/5-amino-6-(5-phosphoribosylamino)uracil reductase RibD [Bacillus altitudinis]AKC67849.1 5-amino-6-(5-phosphoribosylamino)uracil reductase [Bacillus altitudinis]
MPHHERYMKLALENAEAMKGQTSPNPLVGAVIVRENEIVGVGAHMKAGEPHAEIHALKMAGDKAKGATIYVTLEPCSHHGRTGPCAEALVKAGVEKVVVAALDPNPLVAGRGIAILQDAGIQVITGVMEQESILMNEVFNHFITKKTPFVTLKAGITLDGKIASATSDSKWITSETSRYDAHHIRSINDAILVGAQTVIHDDPSLTARIPNGHHPIRIVLDSKLSIPLTAKVVTDQMAPTWIFTTKQADEEKRAALEAAGVNVIMTDSDIRVPLQEVLQVLGERNVSSLMIEGGGQINASFLEQQLVDKLVIYMAPKLIGGRLSPSFFGGEGIRLMSDAIELDQLSLEPLGKDIKIMGYPVYQ